MSKYRAKCQNIVHDARFFVHRQISQKFLYLLKYCKSARKHPGGGSLQNFFRGFSFWCRWWGSNPSSFIEMSCPSRTFIFPLPFSLQIGHVLCEGVECVFSVSSQICKSIRNANYVGCGAIFTHTPTFCSMLQISCKYVARLQYFFTILHYYGLQFRITFLTFVAFIAIFGEQIAVKSGNAFPILFPALFQRMCIDCV